MERLYTRDVCLDHSFVDKKKQKWYFYTEYELKDMYPNGGYHVMGDFHIKNAESTTNICLLDDEGQEMFIDEYSGRLLKNEEVIGYIPLVDDHEFVRVIGKKQRRRIGFLILLALIVTMFLGGLYIGQMNRPIDEPVAIKAGEMTNPNPENIRLPGIERIYAEAGDTHVNQLLLNVDGNAYNLQYTISLKDTGEELYQSKIIEPGYAVKEFNMNRSFEAGEYPIVIVVNSSALEESKNDENAAYNAGQLEAMLIVE